MNTVKLTIAELRKNKGVTQSELADFLGVSFQSVSKWENGITMPDILLLPKISEYFKVSVDEVLGLKPLKNREYKSRRTDSKEHWNKQLNYLKNSRIEFCNFDEQEEIQRMLRIAREDNFKIGIHFPLNKSSYKYRDPLLLSLDKDEVMEAFEAVENEVKYASEIGAEYLLVHFPKSMVVDEELNWRKCKFSHEGETIGEKAYGFREFKNQCNYIFRGLSELSKKYKIQIVLEIEMLNKYLYQGKLLKDLLEEYSDLKLCLDSARLHVLANIDSKFDYRNFIK
ncbi:helix-turn-helix domain-containing protein [Tissierella sp. MB52-C2]|uniref:helix-turn-helix domain-containing protein n=1 Tax=Tissierella sp. MB52-C2 TaxID=3070999 RepID=UPI00280BB42D|nr:helix-turn-helix domain-containing protein [Tissierella sp. MB52-C2]WMM23949.1 helix-turn-helix domain-containing protein [Tissierella sp. MB52-C2]